MNIDAIGAGVLFGVLIGMSSWFLSILLKRFAWSKWILQTLLISLSSILFIFCPTPFQITDNIEWIEITNPGHAGINFVLAYLVVGLICIAGVSIMFYRQLNAHRPIIGDT